MSRWEVAEVGRDGPGAGVYPKLTEGQEVAMGVAVLPHTKEILLGGLGARPKLAPATQT